MNIDKYGEIINGEATYQTIALDLINKGACIIGWTDGEYDHRDILFTYKASKYGCLQRGLRGGYLYVSIMGLSSMGFLPTDTKANGYIMEKLQLSDNSCNNKICDLINGVISEIGKLNNVE